jgi:hypothetical protein
MEQSSHKLHIVEEAWEEPLLLSFRPSATWSLCFRGLSFSAPPTRLQTFEVLPAVLRKQKAPPNNIAQYVKPA